MANNKEFNERKQYQDKEQIKKAATEKAKPRCTICGKYLYDQPRCTGHGSGSGSTGGGSEKSESKSESASLNLGPSAPSPDNTAKSTITLNASPEPKLEKTEKPEFNPVIISGLLSSKLLLIDNDRDLGTLTIKLPFGLINLTEEQRHAFKSFVQVILNELNTFKTNNGISNNCHLLEKDKDGTITAIKIALPTPTLYDNFIKDLSIKKLIPLPCLQQQAKEKITYKDDVNHFNGKPIDTHDSKESSAKNTHTSIRPKTPADGLKPKGWK